MKTYTEERLESYKKFRLIWPVERVANLTLEEYTNLDKNSFTYALEHDTKDLGSIRGGWGIMFGIYRREDLSEKESNNRITYDNKYAWSSRYGSTAEEAYKNIHEKVIQVIFAAATNNMKVVEEIDLPTIFKWKIAFLYMDTVNPRIIPVYKNEAIIHQLTREGLSQECSRNLDYEHICNHYKIDTLADCIDIGCKVWIDYISEKGE